MMTVPLAMPSSPRSHHPTGAGVNADRSEPVSADAVAAFFISSYGDGRQLLRLVSTLRRADPGSDILIHHDPTVHGPLVPEWFAPYRAVIFTSERPIGWDDLSLEQARWRIFQWLVDNSVAEWVVLLSEQDYPIRPLPDLARRLTSCSGDAIFSAIEIDNIEADPRHWGAAVRYYYQYATLRGLGAGSDDRGLRRATRRVLGRTVRSIPGLAFHHGSREHGTPARIGVRALRTPFSADWPCWKGDSWYALNRRAIDGVLGFLRENPRYVDYYRRTLIPVESATLTILANDAELRVDGQSLHFIRWSDPLSPHPDILTVEDLPELLSSGRFFARKLSLDDDSLPDELDRIVLAS